MHGPITRTYGSRPRNTRGTSNDPTPSAVKALGPAHVYALVASPLSEESVWGKVDCVEEPT